MDLGPHAAFIVASYPMAALVVLGLVAWVLADTTAQRRLLPISRRAASAPLETEAA